MAHFHKNQLSLVGDNRHIFSVGMITVIILLFLLTALSTKLCAKTNYLENPNGLGLIVRASKAGDVVIVPDVVYSNAGLFAMSNSSVIIQSQSAGMTVLKGATGIQLSGSSNVLTGLNFYETGRNTNTGLKPLVLLNAQNTIVSNSYFYQAGFLTTPFGHIVDLINNSYSNQITGNVFDGSYSMSVGITTGTTPANFTSTNNIIAQNSFKNIQDVNVLWGTNNGMECIQLGQGSTSIYETVSLYTTVVSNHFYNVTGDRGEIISIKSSDNIIAQNTFSNNNSGIVIRDGDRNTVVGNFFINTNNANTSSHGVDVIGASNLVANNYFEGLETPAIIMRAWNTNNMSGNNARRPTFDNNIINNTIIGDVTSSIRSEVTNATMNLGSSNTFYANNLIYQIANRAFTNNLGHTYTAQSNIIVLAGTANAGNISSGFATNINVEMAKVDGFYRPTNSAAQGMGIVFAGVTNDMDGQTRGNPPSVGADEGVATGSTLAPPDYLEMNDVGTTWTPQTVGPMSASGVVITDGVYKQNILAWTDNSTNEIGFRIERSDAGGAWQTLGFVGHNQTNFTDNKNLMIGTNYQYRIIAVNEAGESSAVASSTLAKAAGGISNTLVADDFNDNIRVNTKADAQDVTWYNVGGDTLDTTNIGALGGSPSLIWSKNYPTTNGANAGMIGYFDKQTLEEGDTLRMSFSVLATSLTNQSRGFRFGLLDSLGTQVADDSGVNSGNRAYSDDKGYSFHVPLGTATQGSMNFDPGVTNDGVFIGSPGSLIGTNVTMSSFGISQTNTKYEITFDVKNLTNSMIVSIDFNGTYSTNMTFSGLNYLNSFDGMAFMWQPNSGGAQAYEFAIDSVRLYFLAPIPEPTTWRQIALGSATLLGLALFRRKSAV